MPQPLPLENIVPEVLLIARAAGAAILAIYTRHCESSGADVALPDKADASPLTEADLAAHHLICDRLERLTPQLRVVSEEDVESHTQLAPTAEFWLIDPLDGTREFLARNGEFTVNIALVCDGAVRLGVVYAPVADRMYWGARTLGAFRDTGAGAEPIRVADEPPAGRPWRVVASKSHLNAETIDFVGGLGHVELIQAGSSLKFCRLAEGMADVYPRLGPTCQWDTAAAQGVLEGAGGRVVDLAGQALRYGGSERLNPHFVASSGALEARNGGA